MEENQPEVTITALAFEPHADAFLGSPFWNAILHRKVAPAGVEWRSSRIFWWIDAIFALFGFFWMRYYRRRRSALFDEQIASSSIEATETTPRRS